MSGYRLIPNILTVSRGLLCPLIIYLILDARFVLGLILFVVTCVTDFLDGYLARRWHATSRLGRILDPLSDKLLTLSFFSLLTAIHACPSWFLVLVFAVTALQTFGLFVSRSLRSREDRPFAPLTIGKWNTGLQFVWIACLLVEFVVHRRDLNPYSPDTPLVSAGYVTLGAIQVIVFLSYVYRGRAVLWRLLTLSPLRRRPV